MQSGRPFQEVTGLSGYVDLSEVFKSTECTASGNVFYSFSSISILKYASLQLQKLQFPCILIDMARAVFRELIKLLCR